MSRQSNWTVGFEVGFLLEVVEMGKGWLGWMRPSVVMSCFGILSIWLRMRLLVVVIEAMPSEVKNIFL
jgi:hypothetical protein